MTTTAFSGPLLWLPEVDSTNSYLKREASGLAHGTCLLAEKQTAGRGRLSRQWTTLPGALAMSLLLKRPQPEPETLPHRCALAMLRALEVQFSLPTGTPRLAVKWPNDILLVTPEGEAKKLCGILCEAVICGAERFHVCGIGMNLARDAALLEQVPHAAFGEELGALPDREALALALCRELERLLPVPFGELRAEYEARCIGLGRPVSFQGKEGPIVGRAAGVAPDGCLLVDCGGEIRPMGAGECTIQDVYGQKVE